MSRAAGRVEEKIPLGQGQIWGHTGGEQTWGLGVKKKPGRAKKPIRVKRRGPVPDRRTGYRGSRGRDPKANG